MKPEDKVCTQKQAEILDKLGITLDTERVWTKKSNNSWVLTNRHLGIYIPAPDVAELGELIHPLYRLVWNNTVWQLDELNIIWDSNNLFEWNKLEYFDNILSEAQAKGAGLIWLIENNSIFKTSLQA